METKLKVREHLNELRKRLLVVLIPSAIIFFVFLAVSGRLISFTLKVYNIEAYLLEPLEYINTQVNVALSLTILFLLPMILFQLYSFAKPAIKESTRGSIIKYMMFSVLLAIIGGMFAAWIFIPQTISFFKVDNGNLINLWSLKSTIGYVTTSIVAFALIFQTTMIIPALDKLSILPIQTIKKLRAYILLICLIVAGIVTPSVSFVPQIAMALPMYISFEVGLLITKFTQEDKNGIRGN